MAEISAYSSISRSPRFVASAGSTVSPRSFRLSWPSTFGSHAASAAAAASIGQQSLQSPDARVGGGARLRERAA